LAEVEFAIATTGPFDLVLDLSCENRSHLVDVVFEKLRTIPGVGETETFMYSDILKLPLWWYELVRRADASPALRRA